MISDLCSGRLAAILLVTAVSGSQACSSGRDDVGTNPTPSITISISPASATVVLGGSLEVTVTVTGNGGFTGTGVTFDLTDAPDGVSFTFFNVRTSGSITTATITTSVAATVEPGTYTIKLTASGTGVSAVSVPFTLTVPAPVIAISLDATTATAALGGSVAIGATLTGSTGFTGAGATFALTGAPAGVTFAVSNLRTNGSVTTATVTTLVGTTVAPGTYTLNLTGSGTGVKTVSVSFVLTVTAILAPVGFTLSANPVTLTTCEGCAAQLAIIAINRTDGFTGNVTLFVTIAVTGGEQSGATTASISPTSTSGNTSMLTVTTTAAPGNYTITITGTAPGFASQTVSIAMSVQ